MVEKRLTNGRERFTGQPDFIFIDAEDDLVTLLDWKTAQATAKYWPLQLGGYSLLALKSAGIFVDKAMTVRLRKEKVDKFPLINVYSGHGLKECERLFINQFELFNKLT
jgi:hypothetical protein